MSLASLVLVIIRDIRGQILQPRISRMTRIMGTEHFRSSPQLLVRIHFQCSNPGHRTCSVKPIFRRDTEGRPAVAGTSAGSGARYEE